ncbi:DUF2203 domain-containing protein [Tumebacillus flagellatus]|uniref:Cell division protein DivIVA n=1 Tax=Tumebacillus flagellatus TaxID=1157490 RepID=A0A074LJ65_9BACL|nr:DUF2203 domain-containing protein [Tumebacillus flagellatus]KEO82226.1 hypothetical protein EL26_16375 [Tumebacillus flagellatus]
MGKKKYFTLAEANALVPRLETMLGQLQGLKRDLQRKYHQLQEIKKAYSEASTLQRDAFFQEEAELEFLMWSANSMLQQILDTGVEVKDIDTGLCDFYAVMGGQEIYLCWKQGEPEITHWHGIYEGFIGRKKFE